jgi:acyl-homoserine-lactone acylase
MRDHRKANFVLVSLLILGLGACRESDEGDTPAPGTPDPYDVPVGPYEAEVRWTSYGIPHVIADDFGSVGFGSGYAFARDHVCTLADRLLLVRSERSKFFGEDYLDDDFALKGLRMMRYAEEGFLGLPEDIQQSIIGYASGYNHYLAEVGPSGLPEDCRDAPWVKPATHIDLLAYYLYLGQFSSGALLADLVATAQPPTAAKVSPPPPLTVLAPFKRLPLGSNGWGIGGERTESGRGMLLSNTHFPAVGPKQWYENHLTVRGELDVYGVSLLGVPVINMGFNEHLAWTHTVSFTPRFTGYILELEPGSPTRYLHDGAYRDMESEVMEVEVLNEDGSHSLASRVMYRSHLGPILNAPVVGWNDYNVLTYRDANENNLAMAANWLAMNKATNLEEFQAAHEEHQGIPWVHTMYADMEGNAYYVDSGVAPNLAEEAFGAWEELRDVNYLVEAFADAGLYVFDLNDPVFRWRDDDRSPRSGLIPFEEAPAVVRDDYVFNANDNYWLSHAAEPLAERSFIYGDIETPRSPRTRMNAHYLSATGEDSQAGADGRFSLSELQSAAFDASMISSLVLKDLVVERCEASPVVTVDGAEVDLSEACSVLSAWDGKARTDSVGAHIWREFVANEGYGWQDNIDAGLLYGEAFDASDPVGTPRGLAPVGEDGVDTVLEGLGRGVRMLEDNGFDLNAPLGEVQFFKKGEHTFPVLGGSDAEGAIAIVRYGGNDGSVVPYAGRSSVLNSYTDLTVDGYQVNDGNSWIMTMEFTDDGPRAEAVLMYSQSEDQSSPHFVDQSELYSRGEFRACLFTEEAILADSALETMTLERAAD